MAAKVRPVREIVARFTGRQEFHTGGMRRVSARDLSAMSVGEREAHLREGWLSRSEEFREAVRLRAQREGLQFNPNTGRCSAYYVMCKDPDGEFIPVLDPLIMRNRARGGDEEARRWCESRKPPIWPAGGIPWELSDTAFSNWRKQWLADRSGHKEKELAPWAK
ncbi:MAG: hypothetical protein JXA37_12985 [Chloroflexia bacterium]|nr:hypothetical protein [Chloroflexia bacterium]